MKICYLICPCDSGDLKINAERDDLVIAVDAGYLKLSSYGVCADVAIGDFDSLSFVPSDCRIISHPVRKDDTDTALSIKYGYDLGYRTFVLVGADAGERYDHLLANLQSLIWLSKNNARGYILGKGHAYTVLSNGIIKLPEKEKGNVSLFSFSEKSCGVCERGLSYTLENAALSFDDPLGVSNSYIGKEACISLEKGTLGIYFDCTPDEFFKTVKENEEQY